MKTLYAHRGMSSLAPENTLSAFKLCVDHQVHWFECDIDILHDGTIVVSHDSTLDRCTDRSGSLFELKRQALDSIDAGSWFSDEFIGERIPTLDQLIDLMNQYRLNANIEIKSCDSNADAARDLLSGLDKALEGLDSQVEYIISSFNPMLLAEFKKIRPQARVACLFETHTLNDDWHVIMQWVGAEFIHPQNQGLTREQVQMFKAHGYKVNVWTVNAKDRANQLFNWGVDGIFTDVAQSFPKGRRMVGKGGAK
ncbi:glycerophosphodiester phosphodiesterase family protein [Pragia fontium]|uniref:Glycerophosphoryl diester phosphodiesterase n=1 Tax=Pragia fontium DSM 5563 = ATCC 49100 TaxID=1122977 RepID=A0AAJ5BHT5_9GAMM|nr:glycerophosphodiester phosphodiesterase family protein [Pragia fontium]SFD07803.1 glycerophosphoryl diester phosphodiesterase [Pragia fontium DSM 5563 = ATCC 49100]VEJ56310.1 Glycerophosphoryl diester phosphodiesterase [Pragia fontium]